MAGPQKQRAAAEQKRGSPNSSSGQTSGSSKAQSSASPPSNKAVKRVIAADGYDGSRDPSPRPSSRPSSVHGSAPGSPRIAPSSPRSSAQGGSQGGSQAGSGTGSGGPPSRVLMDIKNVDLGMAGWNLVRGFDKSASMPRRPGFTKLGQSAKIGLNTFNVVEYPKAPVYQYEVLIGNGVEKRGLVKGVWESKAVQQALGGGFVFDGNRLAWSLKSVDRELRITVDLDAERGLTPRAGKDNKHRIMIRQTNRVRIDVLEGYLQKKCDLSNDVLEAINFLDHVLREHPSKNLTAIKRSFFQRGQSRFDLGNGIEAFKGAYQTMRMALGSQGPTLSINLDVANGIFFNHTQFHILAQKMIAARDTNDLIQFLRQGEKGRAAQGLKKLRRLRVTCKHRNQAQPDKYVVDKVLFGQSARDFKFDSVDEKGKTTTVCVAQYFWDKYKVRLVYPDLPVVKMTKGKNTVLPMEVLMVDENQRYPFKCDEKQTANMIKFAVTPPQERWNAIQHGLQMLNWPGDPVLKHFGLKINPTKTVVDGRVLPAPKVQFGQGTANPGTSGRWDLKGKKFLQANPAPLKSWSVTVASGRRGGKPDKTAIDNFVKQFVQIYTGHGGRVENKSPALSLANGDDVGAWVTAAWNAAGNQSNARPQILVFILPDKDSATYGRIKRSCECRYGVVSQCMQYAHIAKCQAQYISNVCMKFNAKLGGTTCRAIGATTGGALGQFKVPTMVIGADVSHAAPGAQQASMAAITCSTDALGCRYAAACETNGFRVEMIMENTWSTCLKPLIQNWVQTVGGGKFPQRIIYMRDGVSEGQYAHVLDQEVNDMKKLLASANPNMKIPFVVIIGGKRHHVRFFPEKGDRNANPFPGTLIETGVTHPFENDFYLCSHAAIKGTARPMHYHVILNEANMPNDEIYTLLYEQSYQYMRATTPVSQHPAIYYAHIASNRGIPHDPKWGNSDTGAGASQPGRPSSGPTSQQQIQVDNLMPMPNQGSINTSMWYI